MKNSQRQTPLYDALRTHAQSQTLAFDVPGHKKGLAMSQRFIDDVGAEIFKMDANSTKALDLLSNPEGVIAQAEELAAELFGADAAYFLVNGSTAGVQNMILASVGDGEKIIIPRNVHKSAINALVLSGAKPIYVEPHVHPQTGIAMAVPKEAYEAAILAHPDAKAVFVLHPTYHGFTSDVRAIVSYAHEHNMVVLADQAHGSLLSFHQDLPESAMACGADLSTLSIHKSAGSLSQSSLMLLKEGRISKGRVRTAINLMQTSSASYLLMGSLDLARFELAANATSKIDALLPHIKRFKKMLHEQTELRLMDRDHCDGVSVHHDPMKLCVDFSAYNISGFEVYDRLVEEYDLQPELGESRIVLALSSFADDVFSLDRLAKTLISFSKTLSKRQTIPEAWVMEAFPPQVLTPRQAYQKASESLALDDAINRISADALMIYPPGIPIVVPGEVITSTVIEQFKRWVQKDNFVVGATLKNDTHYVRVIKEKE